VATTRGGAPSRDDDAVDLDPRSIGVLIGCLVLLVAVTATLRATPRTVTALAIGGLLALALNPVVDSVQRRLGGRRPAAVAVVLGGFGLLMSLLALVLVPPAVRQAGDLGKELPRVVEQLTDLPVVGDDLERADAPTKVLDFVENVPDRLKGDLSPVSDAAGSVVTGLFSGVIVLLVAVALLIDGPRLVVAVQRLVPPARRERLDRTATLAYRAVGRYVAGSLAVACLAGLTTLAVGLVLGVPLTPLLAANVLVFDLVPQIGGAAGGIPFVIMGFTKSAGTGVICAVFFMLYLQLENNVISPLVVGQAVRLSPPAMMSAALVGVAAGGVVGALVAVPLVGAAKLVYVELRGGDPEDTVKTSTSPLDRLTKLFRRGR
jgi:predicted PurR-regulated permease PerM